MNLIPFFIAQKTLFSSVYQKGISTMTLTCFTGIFIGSFSLALVTAIMHGFEVVVHEKMQGIHAQLMIRAYGKPINFDVLTPVLKKEFPEIKAFTPRSTKHVLIAQTQEDEAPYVAMIKGINPKTEPHVTTLHNKIITTIPKTKNLSQILAHNYILIGKQMARNNEVEVGDSLELLFTREEKIRGRKVAFDSSPAIIGGIFDTGIDEFDSSVIFCSLSFLENMFQDAAIEQVNLTLQPGTNENKVIKKLRDRLGLEVYSWKDLYPALVSALKLEKYVTFFILALITLVASMNIISLLFMQITQKRPDIAILKAMGMTDSAVSMIFFLMGMIISCIASFFGILCACIASWFLEQYPFIELPDAYYVTHLPVRMEWHIIVSVFLVVLFFSFFATWFPAQRIRSINISRVLRFEG